MRTQLDTGRVENCTCYKWIKKQKFSPPYSEYRYTWNFKQKKIFFGSEHFEKFQLHPSFHNPWILK